MENRNLLAVNVLYEDGRVDDLTVDAPLLIGRDADCQLRLAHWRVGRRHAKVTRLGMLLQIEDLGSLVGTRINGIRCAQHFPLLPTDEVIIGPCRLKFKFESPGLSRTATLPADAQDLLETLAEPAGLGVDPSLRTSLHAELVGMLDVRKLDINTLSNDALKGKANNLLRELLQRDDHGLSIEDQERMIKAVVSDVVGLGVIQPLMEDPDVTEIMVNRHNQIFVERGGVLRKHCVQFSGDHAVRTVIERIVFPLGRRIDDASPMVDARLPDGSRVNAVISPIALHGACMTIRKFPVKRLTLSDLVRLGSVSQPLADFLAFAVGQRINILIAGGTGSGKTTLLNILGSQIPPTQRVITIEDAAELQIAHPHVVSLEARPANVEGCGKVTIRDLVRNALRMRPDRIVVGECRGAEAIDMLAAMNTGHDGSLTTLHANSPRDAISRLETMVLMAGKDLPLLAIRDQISRAIELIIQQTRLADGRRVITAVDEVTGMESGQIQLQPLLRFDESSGRILSQGLPPSCLSKPTMTGAPPVDAAIERWFTEHEV